VRSNKVQKIDLNSEYPCPCRRDGHLKAIILTEALGCDRCQQIFALKKDGQVIEQLASVYQHRTWRWTGNRWKKAHRRWKQSSLSTLLILLFGLSFLIVVVLPQMLRWLNAQSMISWIVVLIFLMMLLILSLFVIYRH